MSKSEDENVQGDAGTRGVFVKREWPALSGFVLIGLITRLYLSGFKAAVEWDGFYYALLGKQLAAGDFAKGFSTYWSPLYPSLVGLSSLVFGDLKFAATFVSVVAGSLLVIPVYLLAREFYSRRAALCGAFLVVVCPALADYSTDILTESTYTLLFTLAVLAGWLALSRGETWSYLLTGVAWGACYLTRPEAFAYVVLMLVVVPARKLLRRRPGGVRALAHASVLLAGFLIVSLPYLVYLRRQTGEWMLSEKVGVNLRGGVRLRALNEAGDLTPMDRLAGNEPGDEEVAPATMQTGAVRRPRDYGKILADAVGALGREYRLLAEILPPGYALLAVLGLFGAAWSRERATGELYLALFVVSTLCGYAVVVTVVRYFVPLLPLLIVWASKGCVEFEGWLRETLDRGGAGRSVLLRKPWALRAALAALLALSLIPSVYSMAHGGKWDRGAGREAVGLWLKAHATPTLTVMAAGPWPAFYAGCQYLALPDEEYPAVLDYARRKRVDYVLVEQDVSYMHPLFVPSLRKELGQNARAELELVYTYDKTPRHNIFVFRLREPPR